MDKQSVRKLKRVVVSGLGLVTPLGLGVQHNWTGLLAGTSAVSALPSHSAYPSALPCRVAARLPDHVTDHQLLINKSDHRQLSRAAHLAWAAAAECWQDSGRVLPSDWTKPSTIKHEHIGVCFGQGMVDLDDVHNAGSLIDQGHMRKISPYFVPRLLTNMSAGVISVRLGLQGPNHAVSTACTTGAHSIGDAFNMIRLGYAKAMLCGGTDACVNAIALAGFARCKALSTAFNQHPQQASRPFDTDRDGFVMGEGAGAMMLEDYDHYIERTGGQHTPYALITGYGLSGDAYHMTSPDSAGSGAVLCMQRALHDAGQSACQVHYVNAHATSTPMGDLIEARAIHRVCVQDCGPRTLPLLVSSTKGHTGHLLGAAGAVEAIYAVLAVQHGLVSGTNNLHKLQTEIEHLDNMHILEHTRSQSVNVALSNSFGFGGTNATLCFQNISDQNH